MSQSLTMRLEASDDGTQLSYPETLWLAWYSWFENDTIATGILSFLLHEFFYFGRCVPFMICDQIQWLQKWRLQTKNQATVEEQWHCTLFVLLTHFTVELPQIWLFHPLAVRCGLRYEVPFPSFWQMVLQIGLFFIMEDTWHYWSHRLLHYGPFYKAIHKRHHKYSAPFGLAAEYASPIEVLILGAGTIGAPILWALFTGDLHLVTMYTWIVLRLFQAVDAHSGYDFPWSLRNILPFWAGAAHHDVHHEKFLGNYSSSFRWWDLLMGTESAKYSKKTQ